jgi:hypothetical protein
MLVGEREAPDVYKLEDANTPLEVSSKRHAQYCTLQPCGQCV